MPFVDLSSPVQKLPGKIDDQNQVVAPANSAPAQPDVVKTMVDAATPPVVEKKVDPVSIVSKLSQDAKEDLSDAKGWSKPYGEQAAPAQPAQAAPTVAMPTLMTDAPAAQTTPQPSVNMIERKGPELPALDQAPVTTPAQTLPTLNTTGSIPGANKLPPLNEILNDSAVEKTPAAPVQSTAQEPVAPVAQPNVAPAMPAAPAPVAPAANPAPAAPTLPAKSVKGFDFSSFVAKKATMEEYMSYTIASDASDLHMGANKPVMVRINGSLTEIPGDIPSNERMEALIHEIVIDEQFKVLVKEKELDISYAHSSGNRFRVNIFITQGEWALALRLIPQNIKTIADLKLPNILYDLTKLPHGLVIVAGPTGSGKSTSLAAMLQEINLTRAEHILTIEDPIEYVYPKLKALVDQRELGKDTLSWRNALRAALRQDPNIVLVGEMRDHETIESTITVAETGHLVFATLHTNSASQTIDRIIDVFPEGQQPQIRAQLANVISAVVSQRLIPVKSGGRRAVQEILIATNAVKNAIREGKTYQIDNIIQTSSEVGMQTLESGLVKMVREGEITVETAEEYSVKVDDLHALLKTN